MDAMKQAIMKRRMKLAGMEDLDQMKDADMNPSEGSQDDLEIAKKEAGMGEDGLAPDVMGEGEDEGGKIEIEAEMEIPTQGMDEEEKIKSFLSKDDLGKPGIKGKAAAKMMEALKKLKV